MHAEASHTLISAARPQSQLRNGTDLQRATMELWMHAGGC